MFDYSIPVFQSRHADKRPESFLPFFILCIVSILGTIERYYYLMEATIFQLLCTILQGNSSLLKIAIAQRAKFEGWLKFELAHELKKLFYYDTRVEEPVSGFHIDIHSNQSLIELKTPNTSYKTKGCVNRTCTITDNINSIIDDINKLNTIVPGAYNNGYIAFVLFPVDKVKHVNHVNKVISALSTRAKTASGYLTIGGFPLFVFAAKVI